MHGPLAAALASAHQLDYGVRNKRQWQLESWWRVKKRRDDGSATRGDTTTSRQTRGNGRRGASGQEATRLRVKRRGQSQEKNRQRHQCNGTCDRLNIKTIQRDIITLEGEHV